MLQWVQPSRLCRQVAGWCEWGASGGIVCRQFTILLAANVSISELGWCGPFACCQWWDEQQRSVHAATVWWSTWEGMGVQLCNSPVGWVRVSWPDAWWHLHQQSDGFDAVASTERSNSHNTTDVLLHRQLIVEVDTNISYDFEQPTTWAG